MATTSTHRDHPSGQAETVIEAVGVAAYTIPTDDPEADGTLSWDRTTLVVVEARGGGRTGIGYGYADAATAALVRDKLAPLVTGRDALAVTAAWRAMVREIRNLGRPGICSMAIAAVDIALWDLKAKLLGVSLCDLLGPVRPAVPAYGSGGFTTYSNERLRRQFERWIEHGIADFKMKIGSEPDRDLARVRAARAVIGPDRGLFVDANGALAVKQALSMAVAMSEFGVTWFEEPVSSDNLAGLRRLCREGPPGMEVAAGEYGYDLAYFRRMLEAEAVDVLQADATRCAGITGFLQVQALADAFDVPLSAHTAPTLHAHLGCVCDRVRNVEYFHDHERIEEMLFDGAVVARDGRLAPDRGAPGLGIAFKAADAARFAA